MRRALPLAALLLALAAPAAAGQGTTPLRGPTDPNAISRPERPDVAPLDHRLNAQQARAIALRDARFAAEPRHRLAVYLKGQTRWQVSAYRGEREVAQVIVDDRTARVTESWTGPQVAWTMARGYDGAFGRKVNAPWVWLPLALLFAIPFLGRSWRSWRHADLLVLSAFGASYAIFNAARIDVSVPLVYPLLVYLLLRLLLVGLGRARPAPVAPLVPVAWLGVALVFLVGFRAGLNVVDSNVIDVGYAGVIGADRLADGTQLWGAFPSDNPHGDTYGPIAYAAYVPFEQLLPHIGRWGELPAAHAVALVADLACIVLLFLLGRRLRDTETGVLLAYLWAACPFTLLVLNTNGNDALVGALVLAALLGAASGPARGAFVALAGWAKFAPLGLGPLFLTHGRRETRVPYLLAFTGVTLLSAVVVLRWGDASLFVERTVGFQAERGSPFSVWGAYGWDLAQKLVQGAAVVLAVAVAFVPRRRDVVGLAALAAAVLIALQLGVTHWFYLYFGWWLGPLLVALFVTPRAQVGHPTRPAAARSTPHVAAPAHSG